LAVVVVRLAAGEARPGKILPSYLADRHEIDADD
jgi:hypothetical protein